MDENKMCRLCLAQSPVCYSLLKDNRFELIESLSAIKISEEDSLPKNACVKCWLNVKFAYQIQQNILEADRKLHLIDFKTLNSEIIKEEEMLDNFDSNLDNASDTLYESMQENGEIIIIKGENEDDEFHFEHFTGVNCNICGVQVENQEVLYNHIKDHYLSRQNCDECGITFDNIQSYRNHMFTEKHEGFNVTLTCKICNSTFQYKPLYEIHVNNAHPSSNKAKSKPSRKGKKITDDAEHLGDETLECIECKKVFPTKGSYNQHVRGHTKKKCPICEMEITFYNMNKHIMLHNAGQEVCHICGLTFKNIESLRGHLYYTHSTRDYPCEVCGRVFKKLYIRNLHVKKEHTGEKNHVCDTCGKSFFTAYTLRKHVKMTHLKLRPHICEYCSKAFSTRFALRTHVRQHTNEAPYKCTVCGEGFRQNVSLRAHKKSKHNIVESKKAECKVCGKKFVSDWAVKSHMRLH